MPLLNPPLLLMIPRPSQPRISIMRSRKHILPHLKGQTLIQCRIGMEGLIKVDLQNRVSRNIGCLLVESTMDEDIVLDHEADVSEAVDVGQFVPIGGVGVVDVEGH